MKNVKGNQCSNKAAEGFFIDEVPVCKQHYGNHAIEKMQAEIDLKSPPKEPVPVVELVPCKCKTKEGTKDEKPCQNKAKNDPEYDGMCPTHYNAYKKKMAKTAETPKETVERSPCKQIIKDAKEGSKQCTQLEVDNCDGYCKRHYNLKVKAELAKTQAEQNSNAKVSELESAMATMAEAAAALEAAKNAVVPTTDESKKPKKRVSKKKSDPEANTSPKSTFESITQELINDTSELLAKEIPAITGIDINPFANVEIPADF
jgi:hypothetical protein